LNPNDLPADRTLTAETVENGDASPLAPLLQGAVMRSRKRDSGAAIGGVVVGELLALSDDGVTPLVRYPGQLASGAMSAQQHLSPCRGRLKLLCSTP